MDQQPQNDSGISGSGAPTLKPHNGDAADILLDHPPSSNVAPEMINTDHLGQHPLQAAADEIPDDARVTQEHSPPQEELQPVDQRPHEGDGPHTAQPAETSPAGPRQKTQLATEPQIEASAASQTIQEPAAISEKSSITQGVEEPHAAANQHAEPAPVRGRPGSPSLGGRRPESLLLSPLTHPNGASMFPSMSTFEQEAMALDALSQAEESIVADSYDGRRTDDESDGGYDSDGFSSGSTSAESSVRDYLYANGRRYHRFREGSYNFPNDDVEQEREDMKHAMVKLLCSQKLHFAPIGNYPQEVLDIGTGTGIWAIEMGDQFPSAHVLGIDLSPIQPDWLPPNVRFLVDDIESPWLHHRNHFDYIHSRHTVMAVRDWMRLFRRAYEHLKPSGWIELQEIHHCPRSALPGGIVPPEHGVAQFWARVNDGLNTLGVDLNTAAGGLLAGRMREAGFINVTERVFHVPIGTWPKNKVLKTVGLYWRTILLDGIQAIALGPLTRGLHWNREQVEVFLMEVRRAYHDNSALMYMPLHIIYAQKPETGV
ncbi:Phosphoethanolamine N-methyltransferase 1 [Tolypocladium ophioglossoides CBS 100239]|uniref:Phosphoethanolamine N-methyltransferase 1 n=1 Tax=Tolypocladium ophioglossoides (strain CBS 100239) TaxID=1163406 RepID=A0A0L0N7B3_TOLOC|nr:Phosphoethanolamine N-methyltransferase 1 [Tolypocladium ophioglossoides CBS 100239]